MAQTIQWATMRGVHAQAVQCWKIKTAATDAARAGYIDMLTVEETAAAIQDGHLPSPSNWDGSQSYVAVVALSMGEIAKCKVAINTTHALLGKQGRVFWHKMGNVKPTDDPELTSRLLLKRLLQRILSSDPFHKFTGIERRSHDKLEAPDANLRQALELNTSASVAADPFAAVTAVAAVEAAGANTAALPETKAEASVASVAAATAATDTANAASGSSSVPSGKQASPAKVVAVRDRADLSQIPVLGDVPKQIALEEIAAEKDSTVGGDLADGFGSIIKQAVRIAGLDPNTGIGEKIMDYVRVQSSKQLSEGASSLNLSAYGQPRMQPSGPAVMALMSLHAAKGNQSAKDLMAPLGCHRNAVPAAPTPTPTHVLTAAPTLATLAPTSAQLVAVPTAEVAVDMAPTAAEAVAMVGVSTGGEAEQVADHVSVEEPEEMEVEQDRREAEEEKSEMEVEQERAPPEGEKAAEGEKSELEIGRAHV